jgi:glycosyltransferase involved in cell wall biosynthesis
LRILHVNSARAFGGGERHVVDLTRGLVARGHDIHVAIAPASPLSDSLKHLPGTHIHALPLRNALDLSSALSLARLARRTGAEIIHAHVARDYPLAAFAALRSGARLVITRHVLFPLSRAHRLLLANVSRVIAVSGAVARSLHRQAIFPDARIRVVLNGIDVARFEAARERYDSETARASSEADARDGVRALRIGTVGSLVENKGHDLFLRAAARIVTRVSSPIEFVIVGDEAPARGGEYRERLESLIAMLGLSGRVRLQARWEDTARVLPSFDLFVSASRSEAFGLVMAEALAAGVPVAATATEGAKEIVEENINGLIVPIDDDEALAAAVSSLIEDDARRAAFAMHARESARRRFGLERMVGETECVYLEALTASPATRGRQ